jgi:hypothetical protein
LAAASLLFVMATSVVAFRGWPQVGYVGASPPTVLSNAPIHGVPGPSSSPVLTAINPASAGPAAPPRAGTHVAAVTPHARSHRVLAALTPTAKHAATRTRPTTTTSSSSTTAPGTVSTPPSCSGTSCPAKSSAGGLPGTTAAVTGSVGTGVTAAGKNLGTTVAAVSGALASKLSGVSPAVGALVANTGQTLGAAVTNATGALGGAVSGTGQLLGGILGGHQ